MRTILILVLVLFTACSDDFAPYNRLTSLRVLAIKSEPVAPGPGKATELRALVYTPPGAAPVRYAWSWCPLPGLPNDGYPCAVTDAQLQQFSKLIPSLDLGQGDFASFLNVDANIVQLLCQSLPVDCTGGFPIQIRLVVTSGTQRVDAIRTLRLRLSPEAEADINKNPQIESLKSVMQNAKVKLHAEVTLDQSQLYDQTRERLIFSWFVENGETDSERTSFIDGAQSLESASQVVWTPESRAQSHVYVVVRDNRGGVNWFDTTVDP